MAAKRKPTANAAKTKRYYAVGRSVYEDPAQLDVNKVTNSVIWQPRSGCTAPGHVGSRWDARYRLYRLSETGWNKPRHRFRYHGGCRAVVSRSDASFLNEEFCDPHDTRTFYKPNRISGRGGASRTVKIRHVSSHDKSGKCSPLLHFYHDAAVARCRLPAPADNNPCRLSSD